MATKNNWSLVTYLYQRGYRQKLIKLVTGYPNSSIAKIVHSPRKVLPSLDGATEQELLLVYVIDSILSCRPLTSINFGEEDERYIKLLDYLMVPREQITKMYPNVTPYRLARVYRSKKVNFHQLNPYLLGLNDDEYGALLAAIDKYEEGTSKN